MRDSTQPPIADAPKADYLQQLSSHRITLLLAVYSSGILVDGYSRLTITTWLVLSVTGIVAWGLLWTSYNSRILHSLFVHAAIGLTVFAIGGLWHHHTWHVYPATELGLAASDFPEPVCIRATVVDTPRYVPESISQASPLDLTPPEDQTRFRIACQAVRNGDEWNTASGSGQVTVKGKCVDLVAGDAVQIFGHFSKPTKASNPREFDYRQYERAQRHLFRVTVNHPDCVQTRSRASSWDVRWYPQKLRSRCQHILFRHFPRAEAELACAMLLGTRDFLSKSRKDTFFRTGTIHLLAISGLHLGILAWCFFFVIRRTNLCSDSALLVLISILTLAYAVMTEGRPPVLRASVLIWIICLARIFRRDGLALNSLSAAALIILTISPPQLFQVGFLLSFLAVLALLWLSPRLVPQAKKDPLTKLIDKSRSWPERQLRIVVRSLAYGCAASVSIWCLTLPITAHHFHVVSPIGLVLNIFLWIPVAIALLSGFATLSFSWLVPPVADLFAGISAVSFSYLESIVAWAQTVPGSFYWVAGPTVPLLVVFYGSLLLIAVHHWFRQRTVLWFHVTCLVCLLLHWLAGPSVATNELRCTFLSVGHGNGVVIEFPNRQVWLYDAGSLSGPAAAVEAISTYLWSRHIHRLDKIVVSHADIDHFNGVPELLNRFEVDEIVTAPKMFSQSNGAVELLRQSIDSAAVSITHVNAGDKLPTQQASMATTRGIREHGTVAVHVLHPPYEGVEGSDNANSLVLSLDYLNHSVLLTGDIEFAGLDRLIDQVQVDADIAMAPHHGSARSEPERFIQWCRPEWVVISSGRDRNLESVCELFDHAISWHTFRDGAITATIDPTGVKVFAAR